MGALDVDTAVHALGEGRYRAKLSEDWAIWGPNGGYLASVALRAAGRATERARPASVLVHFLGVADFREVELATTVLRSSRLATSVRVAMHQDGRPVLEALAWGVDEPPAALVHDRAPQPDVPDPETLPTFAERIAARDEPRPPLYPFWDNLDYRPAGWIDEWPPPGPLPPEERWWLRFRPTATFDDPWVEACRALVPIDTSGWPAAVRLHAHEGPPTVIAPTIDLSVRFHRPPAGEWLLCQAVSPVGTAGLVASTARAWDRTGALVASGEQTMLCRPVPA